LDVPVFEKVWFPLPTVLVAQANPFAAKSTTVEKSATRMEARTTDEAESGEGVGEEVVSSRD
jgi:hypothetical protein